MFLFVTFGTTECFLLAAMAYDRYVAIYNPLLYAVSMSPRVYLPLILASYVASNVVRHVFCDIPPLLAISCSNTHINQLLLFYCVGSIEIITILIVLVSYSFILFAILKMRSTEGVSIYHGTILFMYVRPSSNYALEHDMIVSTFYTIVIPMLNPIIYSLRNKDVKNAMKKILQRNSFINKVHF
ncbi:Olfactory receptor 1094 [Lemmus lemmus]